MWDCLLGLVVDLGGFDGGKVEILFLLDSDFYIWIPLFWAQCKIEWAPFHLVTLRWVVVVVGNRTNANALEFFWVNILEENVGTNYKSVIQTSCDHDGKAVFSIGVLHC